jgi:ariadne-1
MSEDEFDDVLMDNDEDYEYDYDNDEDYQYEDENDSQQGKMATSSVARELKNIVPAFLIRENSSGDYFLQIPYDTYIIQPGEEQSILPLLQGILAEVSHVCCVSNDEALALLRVMAFNKERTIERYMDQSETFRIEAAIDKYDDGQITSQLSFLPNEPDTANGANDDSIPLCEICYDTICSTANGFQLGCRHLFCRDCYSGHMCAKISDGPACIGMTCPTSRCNQWIPYRAVKALLGISHPELILRYEQFLVSTFVGKTQYFRYCPGKNCGRVAIGSGVSKIHCNCGLDYCFHCGEEAHEPCSCEQLRQWNLKGNDENENLKWILANTQRCPNITCNYPIEKNKGCNHMTCSQCRYEFCWICSGDWKKHGGSFYECNIYKEDVKGEGENERDRARKESNRYLHYFKRYQMHQDHLKHARSLLETAMKTYEDYLESSATICLDPSDRFLIDTCQQLIEFRRVLMHTYIMGFYLKDDSSDKALFEHQQALLEEGTDLLQELSKSSSAIRKKHDIIHRTQVVNGFFQRLTSSFAGGVVRSFDLTF